MRARVFHPGPNTTLRRVLRALRRWWCVLLAAGVLAWSGAAWWRVSISSSAEYSLLYQSGVSAWNRLVTALPWQMRGRRIAPGTPASGVARAFGSIYVRRTGSVVDIVPLEEYSHDESSRIVREASTMYTVSYVISVSRHGLLFPWREREDVSVRTLEELHTDRERSPEELRVIRAAAAGVVRGGAGNQAHVMLGNTRAAEDGVFLAQAIEAGGATRSRALWGRGAANVAAFLALAVLINALAPGLRGARKERRWRKGLCPFCAYDLRGVRAAPHALGEAADRATHSENLITCPECAGMCPEPVRRAGS